jgi:glycosyltransferase involved in cell wall biosynthesis
MKLPVVSIGMPLYNAQRDLQRVLDSLSSQTFEDFELIISDNASTDKTEEICREYAEKDRRIRYIRQPRNLGPAANFQYVLSEAVGEYFMWAASDDLRSPDFLDVNYRFLENHPDYVASTSPVRFEGAAPDPIRMGDASLTGDLSHRVRTFLQTWHANGRFYSLTRTSLLKACEYVTKDFFGSDWAVMLCVITQGKANRHCDGYVILGREGFSNSGAIFKHYRKTWTHWLLPFLELNRVVLQISKKFPVPDRVSVWRRLIALNLQAVYLSTKIEVRNRLSVASIQRTFGQ